MIFNELEVGDWFRINGILDMKISDNACIDIDTGTIYYCYRQKEVERIRVPDLSAGDIVGTMRMGELPWGQFFIYEGWIYIKSTIVSFCLQTGKKFKKRSAYVTVIRIGELA